MKLILMMNITFSTLSLFMNHPLSMGLILMAQTISIAILTSMMFLNSWYSYILFLILIGGMMILFIYMTTIASNEKFSFNKNIMMSIIPIIIIMMTMSNFKLNSNIQKTEFIKENSSNLMIMFNKFTTYPQSMILIMLFIYLFITMIATIKITKMNSGPLRHLN